MLVFIVFSCASPRKVLIQTTEGNIKIKLYKETPLHVNNFMSLVDKGFYDSLLFHRVIADFMIQGGDPESKAAKAGTLLGNGDVGYTVAVEFKTPNIFHKKGMLAAARESNDVNPQKASSGCQFYIVVGKVFSDTELDKVELRKRNQFKKELKDTSLINSKTYREKYKITPKQRKIYKTIGGTPHLDGSYTVFGEVTEGMNIVEKISKMKTDPHDRPLKDVRIISMKKIK
ncbi:MAG: peptidylprolyl isomerase [Paludibacteraceae bacterium]